MSERRNILSYNPILTNLFKLGMPVFFTLFFISCKKEIKIDPDPTPEPAVERTSDQKLRDSVYFYYKQQSLWTSSLTDYDPISTFTDKYTSAENVLSALMAQTPVHNAKGYSGYIDRFSFLEDIGTGDDAARADNEDGYGIYTTVIRSSATVGYICAFFVEGGSPAAIAGVKRGDLLTSLNGQDLTVKLTSSGIDNEDTAIDRIDKALKEKGSIELEVLHNNGKKESFSLSYKTYAIDPLLKDTVYVRNGKNIGYLAMSSFEEIYNSSNQTTELFNKLEAAFEKFAEKNVTDLILDFRYNIGGYVHTAEYMADKIINSNGNGKIMYTYETNSFLKSRASGRSSEFADVYFRKDNNLEIQNVYFLATENTASASEILISVLKPYFNKVEIIAETTRTYGKPVGFFPQEIMGKFNLWAASFKVVNADGYTDYWDGIPATKSDVTDYVLKDFGDPSENMIAEALYHSATGNYQTQSVQRAQISRSTGSGVLFEKIQDINKPKPRNLIKK